MKQRIERWVRKQVFSTTPPTKVVVHHDIEGGIPTVVATMPCALDGIDAEAIVSKVTGDAAEAIQEHVAEHNRSQRYALVAFDGSNQALASMTVRAQGTGGFSPGGETEPPTTQGFMAQLMRHNEAYARVHMSATAQILERITGENEQIRRRNDELEGRFLDMLQSYEQLMSLKHERDLATTTELADQERKDKLWQKLQEALPTLLEAVSGTGPVKRLVESLDDDQVEKLTGIVRPDQLGTLQLILGGKGDNQ